MNYRITAILFVILPLAIACSSTEYAPNSTEMNSVLAEITGQDGRACVRLHDISGYGAISETTVSVSDKFRKQYLLVTMHRCPNMETSSRAAFKGAFTEFCGRRDSLYTIGGGRCPVQSVFEFENRQAAFDALDLAEEMIKKQRNTSADSDG